MVWPTRNFFGFKPGLAASKAVKETRHILAGDRSGGSRATTVCVRGLVADDPGLRPSLSGSIKSWGSESDGVKLFGGRRQIGFGRRQLAQANRQLILQKPVGLDELLDLLLGGG